MYTIKLPRLLGTGAILQRGKKIHIWGWCEKGSTITVELVSADKSAIVRTAVCEGTVYDEQMSMTRFDVYLDEMEKGGPYNLHVYDAEGNEAVSTGLMVGDVLLISGQSNMEFPMERVRETYPDEWDNPKEQFIRTFKIVENGRCAGPLSEHETGEWIEFNRDSIDKYSAVGYFAAKHIRKAEDVAVGIINVSLGGAPIEAFMSRQMLNGYDEALKMADLYSDDKFKAERVRLNEEHANDWMKKFDATDRGLIDKWCDGTEIINNGCDFNVPEYFSDTELAGHTGSLWLARKFDVPKEYQNREALVWFGTITDFDECYINGCRVGSTPYCYPPRRYKVPKGLLREEDNTIVFRIGVQNGFGRITPGKLLGIIFGNGRRITDGFNEDFEGADYIIKLGGIWKYLIGNTMEPPKDTVFVNWQPTALYNGMLAPCVNFPIKAFAWYQGESNCPRAFEYFDLTKRQIEGYRELWKDENLPYIYVQLPNFNARIEEISYDKGVAWRNLQRAQSECQSIPGSYMVKGYGYGENNDLHPQRKEPIGQKIAEIVMNI